MPLGMNVNSESYLLSETSVSVLEHNVIIVFLTIAVSDKQKKKIILSIL